MPRLTVRVDDDERVELERTARARGLSLSDLVREALRLRGSGDPLGDLERSVETLDRRVAELERVAGQDAF